MHASAICVLLIKKNLYCSLGAALLCFVDNPNSNRNDGEITVRPDSVGEKLG